MPLPTINVPNFAGISTPVNTPNSGRHDATDSAAIALSNEDKADLAALRAAAELSTPAPVTISTAAIDNNGVVLTPKYAKIAISASGTVIAAVASKKIRVLAFTITSNGAVNAKFQTSTGPADLSGLIYMPAAGNGICCNFNPVGWFETGVGDALNINLSAGIAIGGTITYVEV
jgi:autotransporter translocation and assembly factor TamB